MTRYAEGTNVRIEKSRGEIERILQRYGASAFSYGWKINHAVIMFEAGGRRIRFDLPLPDPSDRRFTHTHARDIARSQVQSQEAWEQACRQRWRALALAIKAKLEAVECGITDFESEFLAHIVLPSGETVGRWMLPQVRLAYDGGSMPPLLLSSQN